MSDVERTALKEWAVLVDAMARGDIIAMVRKGGIREQRAGFEVRHARFLLYPTFFHENPDHLAERFHPMLEAAQRRRPESGTVRIEHVSEVLAVWNISDIAILPSVAHEHGMAPAAVESRFHYRGKPHVRLVAVRTLALAEPVVIPEAPRYAGCVSWLELDMDIAVERARPVVAEAELRQRLAMLQSLLGEPEREGA
jgi:hypothetical protein